jgi:addiction module HigA family antidote
LAKALDLPPRRLDEIVHGQRRINAHTAPSLSCYFGTSERFWMNLQAGMAWKPRRTGSADIPSKAARI